MKKKSSIRGGEKKKFFWVKLFLGNTFPKRISFHVIDSRKCKKNKKRKTMCIQIYIYFHFECFTTTASLKTHE